MDVRVMGQGLPPSVQNGEAADPGAQPARIGGERRHGVGGGFEQDRIDDSLVLESDLSDRRGQGEYEVEIGNGQEFGLAVRHPLRPRLPLTLWTVTIATGVVGDPRDAAVVAGFDMAAERRRPACRDRAYHAPLDAPEMCGMGAGVILAVAAKDIGDFDDRPVLMKAGAGHDPASGRRLNLAASLPATDDRVDFASRGSYGSRPAYSAPSTTDCCGRAGLE